MGARKFTAMQLSSVEASTKFTDESLDVVFIDMCHLYDCVKEDLEAWYPKLKYGGYIAGHDISWMGVHQAVAEKFGHRQDGKQIIKCVPGDCWMVQKIKEETCH